MQLTKDDIKALQTRLAGVRRSAARYFDEAKPVQRVDESTYPVEETLEIEDPVGIEQCESLRQNIKVLSVDIAGAARASPLLADADMQELRHCTRQMLANLRFHEYRHVGVFIHHDEDVVLGVDPPSHNEIPLRDVEAAARRFDNAAARVADVTDLLLSSDGTEGSQPGTSSYRPNTAFVMMAIDDNKPELEDVRSAIKETFQEFGVDAITADEIEHAEAITDRILSEIETSEFFIADLTYERPNVYYEIGHAHALNKRVILVRRKDTRLHFDVAHRNCPEYKNVTGLKTLLRKRLEKMMNRQGSVSA